MTERIQLQTENKSNFYVLGPGMETELKHRNPAAFAEFYINNLPSALYVARNAVHFMDIPDVAEQAVDEGMFMFWRTLDRVDFNSNWQANLTTIIRNKAIDYVRSPMHTQSQFGPRNHSFEESLTTSPVERNLYPTSDSLGAHQIELNMVLMPYVEQLPAPQRQVIVFSFFGGLTYQDIANSLGTPLGTIKRRAATALKRLRDLIPEEVKTLDFGY